MIDKRLGPTVSRLGPFAAFAGTVVGTTVMCAALSSSAWAFTLSNGTFNVETGTNGEISSLQLTGDAYPTNYVLNATNAPGQNTADHEWVGELMFTYRLGTGAWTTALTNQSADVRTMTQSGEVVTVTYQNSGNAEGVKNFKLVETYSLVDDYLYWQIALTNTGTQSIEFGDVGLPLPFNEYWPPSSANEIIYQTRVVYHSFTGNNSSYITVGRPSGIGDFLLMVPDATTGAGFEYMDNWISQEHPGSAWVEGGGTPAWNNGLDVFYIHSNVIKSTNRGYLPNTSLILAAGASQTYAFKFFSVTSHADVQSELYSEGLIDTTVVPSLMLATNMTAKIDLHTSATINSVTAQYPSTTTVTSLGTVPTDHQLYQVTFTQLGPNNITVSYGTGQTTTLQFYVLEPIDTALQRHATFMVDSMQATSGTLDHVFDDWMMDTKAQRGLTGGSGWGDDWGWTKGEFLAEKNAQTPVASEVTAVDAYLAAIEANESIITSSANYVVQDWWCPPGTSATNVNNCFYNRPYAYPHAFNTYFSMYKVETYYPTLISYKKTADAYLLYAYDILEGLYAGGADLNPDGTATAAYSIGYMGEQTLPDMAAALTAGGHTTEATNVTSIISSLYAKFQTEPYPYSSEYSYDNTGEEAVYMAAKANGDMSMMSAVNAKTRACRGQEPVWYYYADPVTNNGENWWQFQYTAALAGYCTDDWLRTYSTTPELDERLSYAAKIANISAINSGQIDSSAANLGTVAWTYQAMKGNYYIYSFEPSDSTLHNDWRQMSGEADLGLFGALKILSADVAVDPIFGLYGYGCNVQQTGSCYAITPTDGVFKRLNLITQKLYMEINRDRYTGATISTANDYVGFTLQNQTPSAAHTTTLTLVGLAAGTYPVTVGGTSAGSVTATAGQTATVPLSVGTDATYTVTVGSGCSGATMGTDGGDGTVPPEAGVGPGADAMATDGGGVIGRADGGVGRGVDATTGGEGGGGGSLGSSSGNGGSSGCACTITGEPLSGNGVGAFVCLTAMAASLARRRRRNIQ
jgi:MYXO-CTERM domain-containing protein